MVWPLVAMLAAAALKNNADQKRENRDRKRDTAFARTSPYGGMGPQGIHEADPLGTLVDFGLAGAMLEKQFPGSAAEEAAGTPGDLTKPPGNQTSPWMDMTGSGYPNAQGTELDAAKNALVPAAKGAGDFYYHDAITSGSRPDFSATVDDSLLNGADAAGTSLNQRAGPVGPPGYSSEGMVDENAAAGYPGPGEQNALRQVDRWRNPQYVDPRAGAWFGMQRRF